MDGRPDPVFVNKKRTSNHKKISDVHINTPIMSREFNVHRNYKHASPAALLLLNVLQMSDTTPVAPLVSVPLKPTTPVARLVSVPLKPTTPVARLVSIPLKPTINYENLEEVANIFKEGLTATCKYDTNVQFRIDSYLRKEVNGKVHYNIAGTNVITGDREDWHPSHCTVQN